MEQKTFDTNYIDRYEDHIDELSKQVKLLADALLTLSKEVGANRQLIVDNAELAKRTVKAIKQLTEL